MAPPPLTTDTLAGQPEGPQAVPSDGQLTVGPLPMVHIPARRRPAKASSAPQLMEVGASNTVMPNVAATSANTADWASGGGGGVLNVSVQDVQTQLATEGAALQKCMQEFLA